MRRVGPVALLGGAAALAVAGVGLLLPPGGPRDGGAAVTASAQAPAPVLSPAAPVSDSGGVSGAGSPAPQDGAPASAGPVDRTAAATHAAGTAAAPAPSDRLAGPVPDDEIAVAFAAAVPAADGLDPDAAARIVAAARTGLVDWYADAGWQGVSIQATVVTQAVSAPPPPGVATASVAALWSGEHPVLGTSDRRYATVTLTSMTPTSMTPTTTTVATSTAGGPGTTWTVDSIEGGAGDG